MKKTDIIFILGESKKGLFTTEDLRKLLDVKKSNTLYKTIEGLVKEKILTRLSKGRYSFRTARPHVFEIGNFLYSPSYISFESALNFYNILLQVPYAISSATALRNKTISATNKEYVYTHIDKRVYFEFRMEGAFVIASPEKALADLMYVISKGKRRVDISDMDLSLINKRKFNFILKKMSNRLLTDFAKRYVK